MANNNFSQPFQIAGNPPLSENIDTNRRLRAFAPAGGNRPKAPGAPLPPHLSWKHFMQGGVVPSTPAQGGTIPGNLTQGGFIAPGTQSNSAGGPSPYGGIPALPQIPIPGAGPAAPVAQPGMSPRPTPYQAQSGLPGSPSGPQFGAPVARRYIQPVGNPLNAPQPPTRPYLPIRQSFYPQP